jgi:hypothetical protein
LQTVIAQNKKAFDVLHQRRTIAAQELRYSALEVEHYVFGLKCLVPEPLWLVKKSGLGDTIKKGRILPPFLYY